MDRSYQDSKDDINYRLFGSLKSLHFHNMWMHDALCIPLVQTHITWLWCSVIWLNKRFGVLGRKCKWVLITFLNYPLRLEFFITIGLVSNIFHNFHCLQQKFVHVGLRYREEVAGLGHVHESRRPKDNVLWFVSSYALENVAL